MSDKTKIEWTEATWNPLRGCSRVSEGCRHCYAETVANRFKGPGQPYEGLIAKGGQWNGQIKLVPEQLDQPLRWRRPRRIFVNSMSDLFHEGVPFEYIDKVFAVMAMAHWHTFQVLTKRPAHMKEYVHALYTDQGRHIDIARRAVNLWGGHDPDAVWDAVMESLESPLTNVWLGVSIENQATADDRIPLLLETQAAVHWISAEPLLGPVDLTTLGAADNELEISDNALTGLVGRRYGSRQGPALDWVVVGGESGAGARPMQSAWARTLRDHCEKTGVAFFFKQWGDHIPADQKECPDGGPLKDWIWSDGQPYAGKSRDGERVSLLRRAPKKTTGRMFDGREHNEYPERA